MTTLEKRPGGPTPPPGNSDSVPLRNAFTQRYFDQDFIEAYKEGFIEGYIQGYIEGYIEGRAESVLIALEGRGVAVGTGERQRILACTDVALLRTWLAQTLTVQSVTELHDWS